MSNHDLIWYYNFLTKITFLVILYNFLNKYLLIRRSVFDHNFYLEFCFYYLESKFKFMLREFGFMC